MAFEELIVREIIFWAIAFEEFAAHHNVYVKIQSIILKFIETPSLDRPLGT